MRLIPADLLSITDAEVANIKFCRTMTERNPTEKKDELLKPDMVAVLSRTHLREDSHNFLMPVFEAISNAIHGIDERFREQAQLHGEIQLRFLNLNEPNNILIAVTDNGAGLNDDNYNSFKTPFSGWKLRRKGRGFGRFIAFKVFARVMYSSRFEFFSEAQSRTFRFDVNNRDNEIIYFDGEPDFAGAGVCVEYNQPLTNWHDLIRSLDREDIANQIGAHFLPQFLNKTLPRITIQFDDGDIQDIASKFSAVFVEYDHGEIKVEIDDDEEALHYSLAKVPRTRQFNSHSLLLSAADRIVGSARDLSNKIGEPFFTDELDKKYVVIAVVRGEALEKRLNDSRTGINLSAKAVENIVGEISNAIQAKEKAQVDKIKTAQLTDLEAALRENPILRLGLRGKPASIYISKKPNNWKAEQFISDLAIERFRATTDLNKQITLAAADAENYEASIKDIVDKIDKSKKEALAEYVIHRRNIIGLVESARKFQGDGKHSPEDVIHDLIFRRFSDTAKTDLFEHNLWLIDDALAFLPYISSDRTLKGGRRQKGDKVADLVFFDDSLVLGGNDSTTLGIVEFKKPSRNDYRFGDEKSDPVLQVINTLEKATAEGGISATDGAYISFGSVIRKFGYIIADHTPSLIKVLRTHDFKNDWNPNIYVRYRDHGEIFIQAIGYEGLIENAKKRNQAFFSVLFDE